VPINQDLYKTEGAHVVRAYLLSLLEEEGMIDLDNYPYPPFVPSQSTQEMIEVSSGNPFIVYTYTKSGYSDEWWMCAETMAMRIYSDEEEDIRVISKFIAKIMGRADWSASNINDWITTSGTALHKKFEFKTIQLLTMIAPEEYVSQEGRQAGVIVVRLEFTQDIDSDHFGGMLA
jgi:hypothetical protein